MDTDEPPDGGGSLDIFQDAAPITSPRDLKYVGKTGLKRPAERSVENSKKNTSPAMSLQTEYVCPDFVQKLKYDPSDAGPFVVHASSSLASCHSLKLAQTLHKLNIISDLSKGGIKTIGRGKLSIEFKSAVSANKFATNPDLNKINITATIPRYLITRMGIIKGVPNDWSLDEFMEGVSYSQGCGQIIKARRLNRKNIRDGKTEWVPSSSVVLTFLGSRLPTHIYCFNSSLPVELYQLPSIQCRVCCRFGHVSSQCRSSPRCYRCAGPHRGNGCDVSEVDASCILCSGCHAATYSKCPEHLRQKSIKIVMSEENLSFSEASQRFRPVRTSFADKTRTQLYSKPSFPQTSSSQLSPSNHSVPQPTHPVTSSPRSSGSQRKSYRETVFFERSPRPTMVPGYDVHGHSQLTQSPKSVQPNGCAYPSYTQNVPLSNCPPSSCQFPDRNDNSIEFLLSTIVNILEKVCSSDAIPHNVLSTLKELLSFLGTKNSSKRSSVEL